MSKYKYKTVLTSNPTYIVAVFGRALIVFISCDYQSLTCSALTDAPFALHMVTSAHMWASMWLKGMGATAPQPFDRPELNHSESCMATWRKFLCTYCEQLSRIYMHRSSVRRWKLDHYCSGTRDFWGALVTRKNNCTVKGFCSASWTRM